MLQPRKPKKSELLRALDQLNKYDDVSEGFTKLYSGGSKKIPDKRTTINGQKIVKLYKNIDPGVKEINRNVHFSNVPGPLYMIIPSNTPSKRVFREIIQKAYDAGKVAGRAERSLEMTSKVSGILEDLGILDIIASKFQLTPTNY